MAFFKFRKAVDESLPTQPPGESVEALRRRARHRLIGSVVLVLIGVVGFPLLFDTQPRPVAVDIPIEIPDRDKVKPLGASPSGGPVQTTATAGVVTPAPVAPPVVSPAPAATAPASPVASAAVRPTPPAATPASAPNPVAAAAPASKPAPATPPPVAATGKSSAASPAIVAPIVPAPAPAKPASDDGARAKALLEGKAPTEAAPATAVSASAAEAGGRYIVQVGAFADPARARDVRLKVEKAGLKTYTHVAETKEGKRIRVRVGPFATKIEADKAAATIKGLDLPAAILTL